MKNKIMRQYMGASPLPAMDRRLGATEAIYHLLDKLYCLNFVVFAEVNGAFELGAINRALQAVQRQKPLLRTRIATIHGEPFFSAVDMADAPLVAQALPLRNWRTKLAAQLHDPFEGEAPLARFFWFEGNAASGGKSVAAMAFHHVIADGKSGTALLLEVLRRAAGEDIAMQLQAAHPHAQDLDPITRAGALAGAVKRLRFWMGQGKSALLMPQQLPGYDTRLRPARTIKAIPYTLPPKTGAALQAACRVHATTVHGALGAAQILAINSEFDAPAARRLALNSLADLRGVLGGNLGSDDLGLYIATLTTVHSVAVEPDFWHLARDIKAQLTRVMARGDANLIHGVYPKDAVLGSVSLNAEQVQVAVNLAPASTMLTNIGKVESITLKNGTRIRSVAFMVSPPPQHPICVTVAGYAGSLHLNLLYDQSKMDDTQAARIGNTLTGFIEMAATGG